MNHPTASAPGHVPLAPTKTPIDAPLVSRQYRRMFPELPPFEAEEQFLHALGRQGGLCECGESMIPLNPWVSFGKLA